MIEQKVLDRINKGMAKTSEIKDATIFNLRCTNTCCKEYKNKKAIEGISFETAYLCEKCNSVIICDVLKLWEHSRILYERLMDNIHDEVEIEIKKCDPDDDQNYEYNITIKKEKRSVGNIEFYRPINDFIFEPNHWAHISRKNLEKISKFINKLESEKLK